MIAFGDADIVVTGGVEGQLDAVATAGFAMMRALSTRNEAPKGASRPFDKDRDGFVFGEAGALMVLESEEHAKHAERPSTLVSSAPASPPTVTTSSPPIRKVRERLGPCGERSRPPGSPRPTSGTSTRTRRPPRSATWPKPRPSTRPWATTPRSTPQVRARSFDRCGGCTRSSTHGPGSA